jgi:hypothetical protein
MCQVCDPVRYIPSECKIQEWLQTGDFKMKTAQEFVLNSDSDAHTSEDKISPPQSDSANKEDDKTDTGCMNTVD